MSPGYLSRNRHKNPPKTRCGLRGVIFQRHCVRKPWKAYGRHHGQYVTIGYFASKVEAGRAYNAWAKKARGPDTFLNPL